MSDALTESGVAELIRVTEPGMPADDTITITEWEGAMLYELTPELSSGSPEQYAPGVEIWQYTPVSVKHIDIACAWNEAKRLTGTMQDVAIEDAFAVEIWRRMNVPDTDAWAVQRLYHCKLLDRHAQGFKARAFPLPDSGRIYQVEVKPRGEEGAR